MTAKWYLRALIVVVLLAIVAGLWFGRSPTVVNPPTPPAARADAPWPPLAPPSETRQNIEPAARGEGATVEVCGIGKVPIDTQEYYMPSALRPIIDKAQSRWLSNMLHSGDVRTRATGLLLEQAIAEGPSPKPAAEQSVESLIQLAVGAQDPAVYAMAVRACTKFGAPVAGFCDQVSAGAWAKMDSDNAVPWLLLAANARATHDTAAENAAMAQAAKATRTDSYVWSLLAYAEPALPPDTTPLERHVLSISMIGMESALPLPNFAFKRCSIEAMTDPTVRTQCDALAELWVTKATTMFDFVSGQRLGRQIGWPKDKLAALQDRSDALRQASNPHFAFDPDALWTCDAVNRGNADISDILRLGELGALQERQERSGKTIPELAREYREAWEKMTVGLQAQEPLAAPSPN